MINDKPQGCNDLGACSLLFFIQLLFGCEHWVPCGEHDWLLLEHVEHLCWDILLVNNKAEHILVEPLVGHDECAVEARFRAPAVPLIKWIKQELISYLVVNH